MCVEGGKDFLRRMQQDMQRSLQHAETVRWAMLIDVNMCIGCHACTVACLTEHALPENIQYRVVKETESGVYPHVQRHFLPQTCMHCERPPCVSVCPINATWKEENTGLVHMDTALCIGCGLCRKACPYDARVLDRGEDYTTAYPSYTAVLVGREGIQEGYAARTLAPKKRVHGKKKAVVRKCTFCVHRLQEGRLPACVNSCIGRATFFGNMADPQALISEMLTSSQVWCLKESLETKPAIFYRGVREKA